jgi:hypothetical protein
MCHAVCGDILAKTPIFQEVEPWFLAELGLKMVPAIFLAGDIILRSGRFTPSMYFIKVKICQIY